LEEADVAIIGAGPYGLSVAAHLRQAGVRFRHFGLPMHLWRTSMPAGMFLKSQGFASNLSDPAHTHTLEAFCAQSGRGYGRYGKPVPLDTFIAYGQWFAAAHAPDLEQILVSNLRRASAGFELTLADGSQIRTAAVVVAAGVEHFASIPDVLADLPADLCTHSSEHTDLSGFAGRSVLVIGAGQSALESAALLHEGGATVQLLARRQELSWNGVPLDPDRPLWKRWREPESGLGSGWNTWFYSTRPDAFRHLPASTRIYRARTALGPAGACWLRERVLGKIDITAGQTITWAKSAGDEARVGARAADGTDSEFAAEHVIAATGFRSDVRRLPFLDASLVRALRTVGETPVVGPGYESTVSGLFFAGPLVAPTFGPVMRFVYGSEHAASTIGRHMSGAGSGRSRVMASA
jgi:FAD-dependent urate hydroxylase